MLDRFEFDKKTKQAFEDQLSQLQNLLADYMKVNDHIRELDVAPLANPEFLKELEETPIPAQGRNPLEVADQLVSHVFQDSMAIQHPRFFSFVASSVSPYSLAGSILSDIYNINAGAWAISPGAALIEEKMVAWMNSLIGYPKETSGGIFMSGGSISTFSALITARTLKLKHEDLLRGTCYFSNQTHSSVEKAFRMLGFEGDQLVKIPTDENFRVRVDILRESIERDIAAGKKPFVLIGNLGTTNTGTIDPLDQLADIAEEFDLWFHVDGAFGGSSLVSPIYRNLARGIERSDSVTWDTHKWLMQTYSCSTLLVRDKNSLLATFTEHPEYLTDIISSDHNDGWDSINEGGKQRDSELLEGERLPERNGQLANCLRANAALCPTDNTIIEYDNHGKSRRQDSHHQA